MHHSNIHPTGGRHYVKNISGMTYRELLAWCTTNLSIDDIPETFVKVMNGQAWLMRN